MKRERNGRRDSEAAKIRRSASLDGKHFPISRRSNLTGVLIDFWPRETPSPGADRDAGLSTARAVLKRAPVHALKRRVYARRVQRRRFSRVPELFKEGRPFHGADPVTQHLNARRGDGKTGAAR